MIGYLKGKVIDINLSSLILLTSSGVGYEVGINEKIYEQIISNNSIDLIYEVELFIYHHISENSQSLFGFLNKSEKKIFIELIKISGIGGKVAMQILSLGIDNLISAVGIGDKKMIESIKGIGKKMAEKIIIELKDKDFGIELNIESLANSKKQISDKNKFEPIKQTLVNMGYQARDIDKVLQSLPEETTETGDILGWVIRELS